MDLNKVSHDQQSNAQRPLPKEKPSFGQGIIALFKNALDMTNEYHQSIPKSAFDIEVTSNKDREKNEVKAS